MTVTIRRGCPNCRRPIARRRRPTTPSTILRPTIATRRRSRASTVSAALRSTRPLPPKIHAATATNNRPKMPSHRPSDLPSRLMAAFPPVARADHYEDDDEYDDQPRDAVDGVNGDYADEDAMEDAEEEAETAPRRGRFAFVAAVLGLVVLGTAGAYAYGTMFGSSMIPSLPPIIKADDGPNKILPRFRGRQATSTGQAGNAGAAGGSFARRRAGGRAGAGQSRRAQWFQRSRSSPMQIPGPPGVMPPAGVPGVAASVPTRRPPCRLPCRLPCRCRPRRSRVRSRRRPRRRASPRWGYVGTEKIHTVAIRADQPPAAAPAGATAAASAAVRTAPAVPRSLRVPSCPRVEATRRSPSCRCKATRRHRPRRRCAPAPLPFGRPHPHPPPSPRPRPVAATPFKSTSQRSEAEAQAAYRALSAKYPGQLGGHQPMVRRADLGAKGVYYRALVGPFASMEQAASVCSSLKAAGGNCIVQRN